MSPGNPSRNFTSRELRRRVLLPARVRDGASWSNACILNISSRGMLLHAKSPAPAGSLIEVSHGHHIIVARVIWRSGAKLGLAAEDRLPIEEIATYASDPAPPPTAADGRIVEQRRHSRTHEENRLRGRAMEFAGAVFIAASLGIAGFVMVEQALAEPLALVEATLGG